MTASAPLVVERATYWGAQGGSSAMTAGDGGGELLVAEAEAVPRGTRGRIHRYTPVVTPEPVGPISEARAAGTISPEEAARLQEVQATKAKTPKDPAVVDGTGGGTTQAVGTLPWVGAHLTLGRRP